jgi:excisionase family DNA binding protein
MTWRGFGGIPYHARMQIGEDEVLTIPQAAARLGVTPDTLRQQIKRGHLNATRAGGVYLVTAREVARYDEYRKEPRGFARPDHPLHGKRGGGGRRKKTDE